MSQNKFIQEQNRIYSRKEDFQELLQYFKDQLKKLI